MRKDANMRDIREVYHPITLSDPDTDGKKRSWIMYLPQGTFHHPDYGTLSFSHAFLDEIKQHFDDEIRGIEIALDCDHKASKGESAAPGWFEKMEYREAHGDEPAGLWALVRWTPMGEQLLSDEIYKYFSPEFGKHLNEQTGKKVDNVPFGGALTNRPFLKSMPAIALAETSNRPWSSVKKSDLPRSCFLIQGDPDVKSTWKLPVYESDGHGGCGPLNINGVKAAWAAINGAHTGKKMDVPASVRAKLARWREQYATQGDDMAKKLMGVPSKSEDEEYEEYADDEDLAMADDEEDQEDGGADEEEEGDEEELPAPKGKKTMPKGKKMSEYRNGSTLALAERYALLEREVQRMRSERVVSKTLAAWEQGTFQFAEKPNSGSKARKGTFAITPVFQRAYTALMLSEGVLELDESVQKQMNKVIELALSAAQVNMNRAAGSADYSAPRKSPRDDTPEEEILLGEKAMELAAAAGHTDWLALDLTERDTFYSRASRAINYGKKQED